jgi:ATP-dependent RNA helicase SUPV3L1/SUV3
VHAGEAELALEGGAVLWRGGGGAAAQPGAAAHASLALPQLVAAPALDRVDNPARAELLAALEQWVAARWKPLAPLARLAAASTDPASGPELRALLIRLLEGGHGGTRRIGPGTAGARAARGLAQAGREGGRAGLFHPPC